MRTAPAVLGVALATSLAASAWLWSELREARKQNATLEAALEERSQPAVNPLGSPAPTATPASVSTASLPISTSERAESTSASPRRAFGTDDDWEENQRRLLRDPKYRDAWKAQYRSGHTRRRENAIRLLGLTPAQADEWIELQIDLELARVEAPPVDDNDEASVRQRQDLMASAQQRYQDQARALVGDFKYDKLQLYMESRGARVVVDRYRNQLAETDALRDSQVEPLIVAIHTQDARMQDELRQFSETIDWEVDVPAAQRRYAERQVELLIEAHKRTRTSANGILTSSQLTVLEAMFQRDLDTLRAQQKMNAVQAAQANPD